MEVAETALKPSDNDQLTMDRKYVNSKLRVMVILTFLVQKYENDKMQPQIILAHAYKYLLCTVFSEIRMESGPF